MLSVVRTKRSNPTISSELTIFVYGFILTVCSTSKNLGNFHFLLQRDYCVSRFLLNPPSGLVEAVFVFVWPLLSTFNRFSICFENIRFENEFWVII